MQLHQIHDTEGNRVVHRLPQGDFVFRADLPDEVEYVVTTPAELEVEEWTVVEAEEGVEPPGHGEH